MAWAFQKYLTDKSINALEKEARAKRVGLWADPNPTAPWDFRQPKVAAATPAKFLNLPHDETFSCNGKNAYCKSMKSCAEAMYYLKECGVAKLDRDGDGIPCEKLCK